MKLYFTFSLLLVSFVSYAQNKPVKEFIWPEEYTKDVTNCEKVSLRTLLPMLVDNPEHIEYPHLGGSDIWNMPSESSAEQHINNVWGIYFEQADLNFDGRCEVFVYDAGYCGSGGCRMHIYTNHDGHFSLVGEFNGGTFQYYQPTNGWLRLQDWTQAGARYGHTYLYQFVEGKYINIVVESYIYDRNGQHLQSQTIHNMN